MAKKSMVARHLKRLKLEARHREKRLNIKEQLRVTSNLEARFAFRLQFQTLPRNSARTRIKNRCFVTGRPQGYYRYFRLSRHVLRELGHQCLLPGLQKSSW